MRQSTSLLHRGWSRVLSGLVTALLVGCPNRPPENDDAGVTSSGGLATTSTSGSTGPTTTTTATGGDLTTSGGATSEPPAGTSSGPGETGSTCTEFGQDSECPEVKNCPGLEQLDPDCPEGHKCTVDGDISMTQCVEIVPEAKGLYEPCTTMGDALSGFDDCGLGMLCWRENERGQGICVGLCDAEIDPECACADPKATPSLCQSCAVGVCLPPCDPLLDECADGDVCVPNGDAFLCVVDASEDEGQVNDPCEFVNACDEGLACLVSAMASSACGQDAGGCCTPFCEFPGGACPNQDQACTAWYEPGTAPEGAEHIGVCSIP